MKAEDTVMNRGEKKRLIIERSHQQTVGETQEEMLLEAQAEISFKAFINKVEAHVIRSYHSLHFQLVFPASE